PPAQPSGCGTARAGDRPESPRLMSALAHQLDRDTRGKGVDGPFESWEGDHTALVHVLWAARHQGLTLDKDADTIASMILRSRFLAARIDAAIAEHGCETAQAILRAEAEGHILNAQRFEQ